MGPHSKGVTVEKGQRPASCLRGGEDAPLRRPKTVQGLSPYKKVLEKSLNQGRKSSCKSKREHFINANWPGGGAAIGKWKGGGEKSRKGNPWVNTKTDTKG